VEAHSHELAEFEIASETRQTSIPMPWAKLTRRLGSRRVLHVVIPHLFKKAEKMNVGRGCHDSLQFWNCKPLGVCAGISPFNFPAMVANRGCFPVVPIACG